LHSLGDQPGRPTAHYLAPWRTLPEGTFFPFQKFAPRSSATPNLTISNQLTLNPPSFLTYSVYPFRWTNNIPFPSEEAQAAYPPTLPPNPYPWLPYIAFNYLGQLVDPANPNIPLTTDEYIPLAQGGAFFQRDQHTGKGARALPSFAENPAGNVSNAFTLVKIQGLTGRARIEKQQVLQ
jgi:hypothetical protein